MKDVCVMGLGYIGLPTASLLATRGYRVLGVDVMEDIVNTVNKGEIHIVEPELDILVKTAVSSGNLRASLTPEASDIYIIAVPTPFKEGHQPDISYVEAATRAIAPVVRQGDLVILGSTSPVGTSERVYEILVSERPDLRDGDKSLFYVAHCPERVLPGRFLVELVENDQLVGGLDRESTEQAVAFYRTFVRGEVVATEARAAELAKLTENSFRDVNIAFANELSMICHELNIDVAELIRLANCHPRVNILTPGPGVGGHCLAVDPWFIVSSVPDTARLIRTAREVNDSKTDWVVERVMEKAGRFKSPVVACLGMTYKPDIDDLRCSPALSVTRRLREALGADQVLAVDPNLPHFDEFELTDMYTAIRKADIVVGLVAHREFRGIVASDLREAIVIDTCRSLG